MTTIVHPLQVEQASADPDDNVVIGTAQAAHADFIVSGDRHLLILDRFKGIPIVTVAEALARIGVQV